MADLKEQRVCIKCCIKLRKNATGTFEKLKGDFGKQQMGRTHVFGFPSSKAM
jgi:hypothetical protein